MSSWESAAASAEPTALSMVWKPPDVFSASTARGAMKRDTEEIAKKTRQNAHRVVASSVPYHPLALAGSYHTYRIASKFPIPGGAIEDDKRRKHASTHDMAGVVARAAATRSALEDKADADAIGAQIVSLRHNPVLPRREEDLLPGVAQEAGLHEIEEDGEWRSPPTGTGGTGGRWWCGCAPPLCVRLP